MTPQSPPPPRLLPPSFPANFPKLLTVHPPQPLRNLHPRVDSLFPHMRMEKARTGWPPQAQVPVPPPPQLPAQAGGRAPRGHHGRATGEDGGAMAHRPTARTRARRRARGRQVREGARGRAALARGTGQHERGELLSLKRHRHLGASVRLPMEPRMRTAGTLGLMVSKAGEHRRPWQSLICGTLTVVEFTGSEGPQGHFAPGQVIGPASGYLEEGNRLIANGRNAMTDNPGRTIYSQQRPPAQP